MEKGEERGEWENFFDIHKAADLTLETPFFFFFKGVKHSKSICGL